ncbi:MAG: hypothetical protein JSW45_10025 [Thiotrichales bacterium]|nr:MAG: hypothetical protein JSW45_10025 [Thiotrichales bacterium]
MDTSLQQNYLDAFKGRFTSLMRWHHLDEFWDNFKEQVDDGWYIYHVGDVPPESPVSRQKLIQFINEIDTLLRDEHDEDYCGIVYTDSKDAPSYVKIFDPHNLGVSCGYSEKPPLPGWILSKIPPIELEEALYPVASRRRWWRRIFE